ncbi:uncharacterized protein PHALS_05411 [Plasmopara halstedii]|uniref:Uncharacterized protein n=1 Tax=Plasmopara halstedii TaxID=4781 RepID=A0A0P1ABC7_PLAHL|nr:uncharacterized protein PHALS_05411 [Plasmopara halstedii]CEG37633.1 hypothetical protein PHALS_05411 [Plasmopara halstedii]|eukprot:XP_024574002.1 hypothetical protein PHALS_05411 [Plasmopara halstedii]
MNTIIGNLVTQLENDHVVSGICVSFAHATFGWRHITMCQRKFYLCKKNPDEMKPDGKHHDQLRVEIVFTT